MCQLTAPALLDLLIIKEEVERDIKLKEIIEKLQNEDVVDYSLQQGILKYKNRVVISKSSALSLTHLSRLSAWWTFGIFENLWESCIG